MIVGDAAQYLSEFARLQGRLVRQFLNVYAPMDREKFRDVADGTILLGGELWTHHRHGLGVSFVNPGGIHVNAHVAMAEYPEAIDAGRLFDYLESMGVDALSFDGHEYVVSVPVIEKMLNRVAMFGVLRESVTQGPFPKKIFELID